MGLFNSIRVCHDNSLKGSSSEFFKSIIITHLQRMDRFHSICERWFGVEKDHGKVRLLNKYQRIELNDVDVVLFN